MPGPSLFAADVPLWALWSLPLLAIGFTGIGLVVGRRLYASRAPALVPQTPSSQPEIDSDPDWEERRSAPRHKVRQMRVLISDASAEVEPVEGWLMNRSLGGLGLSVSRAIEAGTIISVRPEEDAGASPWVRVEVRYCRLERGRWTLGCKFVDDLPSNSLVFG